MTLECLSDVALEDYLRQALDVSAERAVEEHLELCSSCAERLTQLNTPPSVMAHRRMQPRPTDDDFAAHAFPRVPGYELAGILGRGGMGIVYRAREERLGREVAVKVLAPSLAHAPAARQRFVEEAHITGQLQHPSIVVVHELGELADGRPFLAMKLIRGRTLAELLHERSDPKQDLPRFLQVFGQVCQALGYAHAQHVIHRDLKPHNIMVGTFGEVQVMDWGLAKVVGTPETRQAEGAPAIQTPRAQHAELQTAAALGTWAYMSPEQARGEVEKVDERADVFSLGAILCEILTGGAPYQATASESVRKQAEHGLLGPALNRLEQSGADPALRELTSQCLAASSQHRPRDAAAVASALAAFQAALEGRLRRAELEQAEVGVRRLEERKRRRLRAGLAIAAFAVAFLIAGMMYLRHSQRTERTHAFNADLVRAADLRDGARWDESRRALDQANERLGDEAADQERERIALASKDLEVARRLDRIRIVEKAIYREDGFNRRGAEDSYEAVFRDAGFGVPKKDAEESVAARIRASAIQSHVLVALDDWGAFTETKSRREWLFRIARHVDPDPIRGRFRDASAWGSTEGILALAAEAEEKDAPSSLVIYLAEKLIDLHSDPRALVRKAHARQPTDFWLTYYLAYLVARHNEAEAIGYYWAALALRPRTAVAYNGLGLALHATGDIHGAIGAFHQAIDCDPKLVQAHSNLGNALGDKGLLAEALAAHRRAIECDPSYSRAYVNLGNALLAMGDAKGALAAHHKALELHARLKEAYHGIGIARMDAGDHAGAILAFRQAIDCDPKYGAAYCNLGRALQITGNSADAMKATLKAIEYDAKPGMPHNNLGLLLYERGDYKDAVAAFQKAIACEPNLAMAHTNLTNALLRAGDVDNAQAAATKAARIEPGSGKAHYNVGSYLHATNDLAGAEAAFRRAIECEPKLAMAHTNLGNVLIDSGNEPAGIAAYRTAIACDPKLPQAHKNLGMALQRRGDLKEAIAEFRMAVKCDPTYALAYESLASALRADGDASGAIDAYRKGVEAGPNIASIHYNFALLLRDIGDLPGAIESYRKAVECNPKLAQAHYGLGLALHDALDITGAAGAYRKAVECDGKYAYAHNNLGNVLLECDDVHGALFHYRRAIASNPKLPQAHKNLGVALHDLGDLTGAIASLQTAVECNPQYALAQQRLKRSQDMLALLNKLPTFIQKPHDRADVAESLDLAWLCSRPNKKFYRTAAEAYAASFAAQPKLADDLVAKHRYHAAVSALLAGAGHGWDAAQLTAAERTHWRTQALAWLKKDLDAWTKIVDRNSKNDRRAVHQSLFSWQHDARLASIRQPAALARLPESEQAAWRSFWNEVALKSSA